MQVTRHVVPMQVQSPINCSLLMPMPMPMLNPSQSLLMQVGGIIPANSGSRQHTRQSPRFCPLTDRPSYIRYANTTPYGRAETQSHTLPKYAWATGKPACLVVQLQCRLVRMAQMVSTPGRRIFGPKMVHNSAYIDFFFLPFAYPW